MPQRERSFPAVRFPASLVGRLYERWKADVDDLGQLAVGFNEIHLENGDTKSVDTFAAFLEAYRSEPVVACTFSSYASATSMAAEFWYYYDPRASTVKIRMPRSEELDELLAFLETNAPVVAPEARGGQNEMTSDPPAPRPSVFIGHGGKSQAWRDLRDFLRDQMGIEVVTFESESRAGSHVVEVLRDMLDRSNFAFLVHTREDETDMGRLRARQNVVHETGLFQGRLGFDRAIIVREEGTESFSNVDGLQEIRYESGNISAAVGSCVAVLRREFGPV